MRARAREDLEKTEEESSSARTEKSTTEFSPQENSQAQATLEGLSQALLVAARKIDPNQDHESSLKGVSGLTQGQYLLGIARILHGIRLGKITQFKRSLGAAVAWAGRAGADQVDYVEPDELWAALQLEAAQRQAALAQKHAQELQHEQAFAASHQNRLDEFQAKNARREHFDRLRKRLVERICEVTGEDHEKALLAVSELGAKMPREDVVIFLGVVFKTMLSGVMPLAPLSAMFKRAAARRDLWLESCTLDEVELLLGEKKEPELA